MSRGILTVAVALLLGPLVAGCGAKPGGQATPGPSGLATLAAGKHTSAAFKPTISFTVPDGWTNPVDDPAYFELVPLADQNSGVHFFHDWEALSQDATCPDNPQAGVGTSATELVAWIRSLKGLSVTQPTMVTVGGLHGTAVDVSVAPTWKQACPFANGLPSVPLLIDPTHTLHWVVAGPETLRLYLVDLPGQGTLIVDLDSFDGVGYPTLLNNGGPIVRSLAITTGQ